MVLLPTPNCLHFLRDCLRALCRSSHCLLREKVLRCPTLAEAEETRRGNFYSLDCLEFPLLPADLQWFGSPLQPMELQDVASFLDLIFESFNAAFTTRSLRSPLNFSVTVYFP